jgi:hypothetical protein
VETKLEATALSAVINFEDRPSDQPLLDRVWRSHSELAGTFRSMASSNCGIVISRVEGRTSVTVRGPETHATLAECPADGEWVGVSLQLGVFMRPLPAAKLRDRNDVTLPVLSRTSFLLDGSAWEIPTYENIETFVRRLVAKGLIGGDPRVTDLLHGDGPRVSERTAQRRVVHATGLTPVLIHQIARARRAARMLRSGGAIVEIAQAAGYFDQAHLTRSLRRFVGQTPLQIARADEQLSLLYNTDVV